MILKTKYNNDCKNHKRSFGNCGMNKGGQYNIWISDCWFVIRFLIILFYVHAKWPAHMPCVVTAAADDEENDESFIEMWTFRRIRDSVEWNRATTLFESNREISSWFLYECWRFVSSLKVNCIHPIVNRMMQAAIRCLQELILFMENLVVHNSPVDQGWTFHSNSYMH